MKLLHFEAYPFLAFEPNNKGIPPLSKMHPSALLDQSVNRVNLPHTSSIPKLICSFMMSHTAPWNAHQANLCRRVAEC